MRALQRQCEVFTAEAAGAQKNALQDVAVQESEDSINGTAEALRCCPIMPLFFHIAPYLHRKQPGNYLTRGVKKPLQIVAAV